MLDKSRIFRRLGIIIIALLAVLITINLLYIKELCSSSQCFVINVSVGILVVWAIAFWLMVLRYTKKE